MYNTNMNKKAFIFRICPRSVVGLVLVFLTVSLSAFAQPTAQQWNREVTVGWNLGNQFECSAPGQDGESMAIGNPDNSIKAETAWGNPVVTKKTIAAIKEAGFNAVRIPVRWQCHITNPTAMSIDKEWIARIKEVVDWCLSNDLKVIINTHHDKWLEGRPTNQYKEENNQKLALLWTNIASEFAKYDYRVAFAGTNEVHVRDNWGKPTAENLAVQNSYNQTFVDVVRATGGNNEKRHLIVQTYVCNPDFGIDGGFIIPRDIEGNGNRYMSVEFHYYTPWEYAGECKRNFWGGPYAQQGEGSADDEKTMSEFFDRVVSTWSNKGLGIVIGEWGVTDRQKAGQTDLIHENITYYCRFLVSEARKRGFSTFVWDNNQFGSGSEHFGIFDRGGSMKLKAPWVMKGITEGVAASPMVAPVQQVEQQPSPVKEQAKPQTGQAKQTIKGMVADAAGPLIGATVKVVGMSTGTVTDLDGNFTISSEPGAVLEISYVGYKTKTVKAQNGMNVLLDDDGEVLDEVVVTALGIKRERKALGYALSEVNGEELTKAKETNVINSLSGKVAGLVVQNTAGGASGSTRVLLRGNTEMTGDNQPLYVIDGVPLDNTNFGSAGTAGGYDLGDGISAINPDDIENMTVLKGPAASALYGSRASHGVILITTKKAEKDKIAIEYNGSFTVDTQLAKWDDIQQVYGMGYGGQYSRTATTGTNASWGPKADDFLVEYFDHEQRPFLMFPNNTSGFFRDGFTTQNTAILSVNAGKTGVRFSMTDMRNKDILPNTHMSRDNFNLRVTTAMGPVDFDFTANYTREDVKNRPALGDSQSNVGKNLMTLAGTYNQEWLKNYETAEGDYANWNGNDQYNKNPYWDLYKNDNTTAKDVFRFTGKAVWNIDEHLKLQGTIGTDINNMTFEEFICRTTPGKSAGQLQDQLFNNRTLNAELLALYNNSWGSFDFNATMGGNIFKVNNNTNTFTGIDQQMKDIIAIMNYAEQSVQQNAYKKQINSLYGSASVGYDHTYYLEATLRGDKSSTLPLDHNVYLYPSFSGSVVFSEFIKNKSFLNYGKVRASWAQVGSDTDPYQLALNYTTGKYSYGGYVIGMINNYTQPNKDLKPTRTNSYELGMELKFFHNRLNVDLTYYNQLSKDQIIGLASSSTSGYNYRLINAGEIQNKGIEVSVNGRVLDIKGFAWDAGLNFSKNQNRVNSLVEGMDYFELEKATWCGVSVGAEVGENYGSIIGKDFKRNDAGQVIINPTSGLPFVDDQTKTLGNASWDWTGGFYSTFTYKNFRLVAAFDVKLGADLFSMSMRSAYATGRASGTLEGREEWYRSEENRKAANMTIEQWRAAGKCEGLIVQGVIDNGDGTYRQNDIPVNPEAYWKSAADNAPGMFIYDNSYVKCREITFGYTFPEKMLGKVVKGLSLSFVARNPFIVWKNIPNIDPDSGYNTSGLGLEYGSLPSRRSYGFNVNVKF